MNELRKAAEMALEALELSYPRFGLATEKYKQAIQALRQALAEPEPWVKTYCGGKPNYCTPEQKPVREVWCDCGDGIMPNSGAKCGNCLASESASREWVGLTDEEKVAIYQKADDENWHDQPLLEAVEAKLKEKNA